MTLPAGNICRGAAGVIVPLLGAATTPEARRMVVLVGVIFALLALGAAMLRTRWNLLLIAALSAAFVAGVLWFNR